MSFEGAVALAQVIGVLCTISWLALPITAALSIFRRRRYGYTSRAWFASVVLGGWILTVVLCAMTLVTGAWYGENGPRPQIAAVWGRRYCWFSSQYILRYFECRSPSASIRPNLRWRGHATSSSLIVDGTR